MNCCLIWFAGQGAASGHEGLVEVNQASASTSQQPGISLFRLPTLKLRGVTILGGIVFLLENVGGQHVCGFTCEHLVYFVCVVYCVL